MPSTPKYRSKKQTISGKVYRYAYVQIQGKDISLGKWNSKESKQKYKRLIAEYFTTGETQEKTPNSILTITDLSISFIRERKNKLTNAETGEISTEFDIDKFVIAAFRKQYGNRLASSFGAKDFKAFRQQYIDVGLKYHTINRYCSRINELFRLAAENEQASASIWHSVKAVKKLKRGDALASQHTAPVSESDIEKTIPFMPTVVAAMVEVQLLTGMRPDEVRQLKPVEINRSGKVWIYAPTKHKNAWRGQQRLINIGPKAQAILLPYLLRSPDAYCFSPRESAAKQRQERSLARKTPPKHGNSAGTNRKKNPKKQPGECYESSSYRNAILRAAKSAGVPDFYPRQLRVTAGRKFRQEFGVEAAQAQLGHKDIRTTETYYAPADVKTAIPAALAIG
jgi:integrase